MPQGLDLCVFDTNVNNGVHTGVVLLQRALGITADGIFGPQTNVACLALKSDAKSLHLTIAKFYSARRSYYMSLRTFRYFGNDWLRRDLDIEKESFAMVAA